jgi:hypothetical protein
VDQVYSERASVGPGSHARGAPCGLERRPKAPELNRTTLASVSVRNVRRTSVTANLLNEPVKTGDIVGAFEAFFRLEQRERNLCQQNF